MENSNKERFESLWNDFTNLVKGKLLTIAKKQTLSTPLAKLILTDVSGAWGDDYTTYGRWLQLLSQNDSPKAELIKEVLQKDITFTDVEKASVLPDYCNYLIPGIGACAGYATSCYFELGKIAQVATVLLPAILLYPAVKMFRNNQTEAATDKIVTSYMEQLDKYKNSILSILS